MCSCCNRPTVLLGHLSDVCEECYFRCADGPICDRFTETGRQREAEDEAVGAKMHEANKRIEGGQA